MSKYMRISNRLAKSFTLEREINEYVTRTKGEHSASERVNQLLKRAMQQELYANLEAEAEEFFVSVKDKDKDKERRENHAFQVASIRAITRD